MTSANSNTFDITIIGSGFCGSLLLANIINKANFPLKIAIIEKSSNLAKGVAYSTENPLHLLNVRAAKMGAFEDDPEHFYQWLLDHESEWRKIDPAFIHLKIDPHGYLPRKIYGAYLVSLWNETLKKAVKKNIQITLLSYEAIDLEVMKNKDHRILLKNGEIIESKISTLAIGVMPNRDFWNGHPPPANYISDIWNPQAMSCLNFVPNSSKEKKIVIIGSGLTMLDAVTTLLNKNYEGSIFAISREGKLPETHKAIVKPHHVFIDMQEPPVTALDLLKKIRREISKVNLKGGNWRSVIDALRPITISLWTRLPIKEKNKIIRSLFSLWNRHRHRVPQDYLTKIDAIRNQGKLSLIKGSVQSICLSENKQNLTVAYKDNAKNLKTINADYVINCSGPNFNLQASTSPLIRNLLKNKVIQPHPLNLGIAAGSSYEISMDDPGRLYALGQILIGERFECIAVPELREQCSELADTILKRG